MKRNIVSHPILLLVSIVLFAACGVCQNSTIPRYSTRDAKDHIGEYARVYGHVQEIIVSRRGDVFLNIDGLNPKHPFVAPIFLADTANFPKFRLYQGTNVVITGKIEDFKGRPEIRLRSPNQIQQVAP